MLEFMRAGGILMWFIAALSVIAVAVLIERCWFFYRATADAESLELAFGEAVATKNKEKASKIVRSSKSSLHRIFFDAYAHWGVGCEEMKLLLEQLVRREVFRWEKHLYILELVGKLAPLLGLLGTVLGMSEMFQSLHLEDQVNAAIVTGGIWKALFTTIAGLTVAIPVLFAHGILTSRVDNQEETLNRAADFLIRAHFSGNDYNDEKK